MTISQDGRYQTGMMAGAKLLTLGLAIDLNQAGQADLEALPGIGPALASRIIEHRLKHGPFKKIEDLERVSGIGLKKLEQIKHYLAINP